MTVAAVPTIVTFPEDQLTLDQRIEKWTWQLCRSLEQNYQGYYPDSDSTTPRLKFRMEFGRKYIKVIQQEYRRVSHWEDPQEVFEYRDGSVHAFVDKKTGEVYKPAGWAKPAKHVRFDMRIISDRAKLHDSQFTDWAGGYLYLR
tara:strand:+ start:278 stop:709 length:432 start_codon:yes stop_codon:yes gene_type:complete